MAGQSDQAKKFELALKRFDETNSEDPNQVDFEGRRWPKELLYAHWLSGWVRRLAPNASEELQLAARSQHIRRWEVPRDSYPATREGYLQWRTRLKQLHAERSEAILRDVGYGDDVIQRVRGLNLKQNIKTDPECQVLEDALCLIFLERQLDELAERSEEAKLINALRKSWAKMSRNGRRVAMELDLPPRAKELVQKAQLPAA